jgi:hypothetical protein
MKNEFSCSEVLELASDSPDPSARIGKGSRNISHCCGVKGHPKDDFGEKI